METLRRLLRDWLPPVLTGLVNRVRGCGVRVKGNYASWDSARLHSSGYDADEIFRRVREAALKVKQGEAVSERDGVCFFAEKYNWEVLACLMLSAAENEGELNVLDFGGALGSFYFQHKKFFSGLRAQRWGVVEQKHFVECGRAEFENENLKFYFSVTECVEEMPVDLILLSSVLQYIEKPYELLAELGNNDAKYIVVTRTPFVELKMDKIVIQQVPKSIFPAKLPMWIFSEENFERAMNKLGYRRLACFPCAEGSIGSIKFSGIIYRRDEP